jgi:hypothetical protein
LGSLNIKLGNLRSRAHMEAVRNACKILIGKPEEKSKFVNLRSRAHMGAVRNACKILIGKPVREEKT